MFAIKGSKKYGKEIIEALESLGGINEQKWKGSEDVNFMIDTNTKNIISISGLHDHVTYFTYTEFMLIYSPLVKGDKIYFNGRQKIVTGKKWLSNKKTIGIILDNEEVVTYDDIINYGKSLLMSKDEIPLINPLDLENKLIISDTYKTIEISSDKYDISIIDGKILLNKIDLTEKEKDFIFPESYDEARKLLANKLGADCNPNSEYFFANVNMDKLAKLIACRNAYWSLYKDWKPNWKEFSEKYIICILKDEVKLETTYNRNTILAFPTKLSRNTFYETFRNEIEELKELL